MTKVKRCSQCGKEVSQGGSFCPFCGNIINENVKSESRESAIYGLDDDTQKKYQTDINKKLQKQKHLEYQKENLLKKKKSLGLKIDNYSKIIQKEIPSCERNKTAPNMPVIKIENSKMDVKWYIAACIAVLEFISGFMPWVSLYYADLFQGQTISCAGIFDLLNDISKFEDWTNSTPEVLRVFVFIIMFGFVMLFINGYFIAQVLQKRESEVSGTIAGISGIVVSVAILLYKISMEEDDWRWISINTQVGVWLMLLAGIALICVIVFYKSDTEAETKNKSNFEFEVMNYDPVLPVRMKTLKIRKENDKLILELTYAEFEWAGIEEFIVDIQLVRYDGTVNTFVQNALFEKKGQNFARFQLQDAGYDLDGIASARVNILVYNIYKSQKKHKNGNIMMSPEYSSIYNIGDSGYFIACESETGMYGIIDENYEWICEAEYSDIYKVWEDSTDNLVKVNGEYLLIAEYDFQEGHGAEIINEYGETIVPMEYYDINSQCGMNRLVVENSEGYYGAIDLEGNLEVPCQYDELGNFSYDNETYAMKDNAVFIVDIYGNERFLTNADECWQMDSNLYEVGINENWNVIDSNGEYLFSETHDNHEVNEKYIAGNNEEKKHGMLILKSGEVVNTEYQKYMLSYTVPDIVGVYDGANYGMLGSNGELIVPCSYDSCEISEDGAYITADRQKDEYGNYTECTLFDSNGNKIETFDTGIYNVGVFRKISNAA